MKKFHIFVEGDADLKFLHDYIEVLINDDLKALKDKKGKIIKSDYLTTTGGWAKIDGKGGDTFREKMKENTSNNILNLVVFDADSPENEGGFAVRKREIEDWKTRHGLTFELFLFPNNEENGELENLLEGIINPQNATIFCCWENFEECLTTKTTCTKTPLTIPAKKSKIYAYMEVLHGDSNSEKEKIKDPNRDFKNTQHWDLSAQAIGPLKKFLQRHIV